MRGGDGRDGLAVRRRVVDHQHLADGAQRGQRAVEVTRLAVDRNDGRHVGLGPGRRYGDGTGVGQTGVEEPPGETLGAVGRVDRRAAGPAVDEALPGRREADDP